MFGSGLSRVALGGALGFGGALRRWPSHPQRREVLSLLGGRWCLAFGLVALVLGLALQLAFEYGRGFLLALPPFLPLHFIPGGFRAALLSAPVALGLLAAWRLRALRRAPGLRGVPGQELFEIASVPLVALCTLLVLLIVPLPWLATKSAMIESILGATEELPSWRALSALAVRQLAFFVIVTVTLGSVPRASKGFGTMFTALSILVGLEYAMAFAIPAAKMATAWLPWRHASRTAGWVLPVLLYTGAASMVWLQARERWHSDRPVAHTASPPLPPPPPPQES